MKHYAVLLAAGLLGVASFAADGAEEKGKVFATILNIRAGAGTGSVIIAQARSGDVVKIKGEKGDWYHVELANGKTGFAAKNYIRKINASTASGDEVGPDKTDKTDKPKDEAKPGKSDKPKDEVKPGKSDKPKDEAKSDSQAKDAGLEAFLKKYRPDAASGRDVTVTGTLMDNGPKSEPRYFLLKESKGKYVVDYYLDIPGNFRSDTDLASVRVVGTAYQIPGWKHGIIRVRKVTFLKK